MVQGKKLVEIDKELIINKIGAFAIYNYYIDGLKIGVPMKSPFRRESNPSFVVKQGPTSYYHKDYGAGEYNGTCIDLVVHLFSLSVGDAIKKIAHDFGLLEENVEYKVKLKEPVPQEEKKRKIPDVIEVIPKPFGKEHLEYLSSFHISPNSLDIFPDVKVTAIKEWRLNRATMPLKRNEPSFAYIMKEGIKIYKPFEDKLNKWKSTIPFRIIMGLQNLKDTRFGIITKSLKDAFVIGEHITKNVCCVQGEDITSITDGDIEWINGNCKQVYLNFDGDHPGKKASLALTQKTGWKHINVPDEFVEKGIKDFADFTREYGPQALKDYFKSKIKEL